MAGGSFAAGKVEWRCGWEVVFRLLRERGGGWVDRACEGGFCAENWHGLPVNGNGLPASGGIGVVGGGRWSVDVVSGVVSRVIRVVREGFGVVSRRSGSGSWPNSGDSQDEPTIRMPRGR